MSFHHIGKEEDHQAGVDFVIQCPRHQGGTGSKCVLAEVRPGIEAEHQTPNEEHLAGPYQLCQLEPACTRVVVLPRDDQVGVVVSELLLEDSRKLLVHLLVTSGVAVLE